MKKSSFWPKDMNKLLILASCTKFECNSLRNIGITITDVFGSCRDTVRNDVISEEWLGRYNYFAKFYDWQESNARDRPGGFLPPPLNTY